MLSVLVSNGDRTSYRSIACYAVNMNCMWTAGSNLTQGTAREGNSCLPFVLSEISWAIPAGTLGARKCWRLERASTAHVQVRAI